MNNCEVPQLFITQETLSLDFAGPARSRWIGDDAAALSGSRLYSNRFITMACTLKLALPEVGADDGGYAGGMEHMLAAKGKLRTYQIGIP